MSLKFFKYKKCICQHLVYITNMDSKGLIEFRLWTLFSAKGLQFKAVLGDRLWTLTILLNFLSPSTKIME
jgi:hypothetical protein